MRGSGSPSGVQNVQRQKAAPLGTRGDSELGSSTKGLILGGPGLCSASLFSACASSSEQGLGAQAAPPPCPTCWVAHQLLPMEAFPFNSQACSPGKDKVRYSPSEWSGRARNVFRLSQNRRQHALHPPPTGASLRSKQLQQLIGNTMVRGICRSPSAPPHCLHSILAAPHTCRLTQGHKCTPFHACTYTYTCRRHRRTLPSPPDTRSHAGICRQAHTRAFL